jgi:RimJ/RimL family protein N-acetyltransferase
LIYLRRLEVADAEALLEMLVRDRAFLDQWEPTRSERFYVLETHQRRLEALQGDEGFADFGIFLTAGDELVGRIQLSGIARGPFQNAYLATSSPSGTTGVATRRRPSGRRSTPPSASSAYTACRQQ